MGARCLAIGAIPCGLSYHAMLGAERTGDNGIFVQTLQ